MGPPETKTRETVGFIDAHSHLRSTSYSDHGIAGESLEESLLRMSAMTSVDIEDDVFVACSELIEKGVTGVQAMFHTFGDPDDYELALDATIAGVRRSGIRALIVLGTTDQAEFLPPQFDPTLELPELSLHLRRLTANEFGDVVERSSTRYPETTFGVGPVGPQWCSDPLLHTIGDISRQGFRVHSHFAESRAQRQWAGDLFGRMKQADLLGPHTSLAHAVWLTDEEEVQLADLGVSLVTCPLSNHLLNAGRADVSGWQSAGIRFGVGLDSADCTATPMAVAGRVLTPADAEHALTIGGHQATGIDSRHDRVIWADADATMPDSVAIAGIERVVNGRLVNHAEVDEARARISAAMRRDSPERAHRHQILDRIMPHYLKTIREATGDR